METGRNLSTSTVTIREIGEKDIPIVQLFASDPEIAATSLIPSPYPEDGARQFILNMIDLRERGTDFVFAVLADGHFVGVCALHDLGGNPSRAEMGYWIARPFWGRGYGSAAAAKLVRWAFEALPLSLITAHCLARNTHSIRILRGLGFTEVAREPNTNPKWMTDEIIIRFELHRGLPAAGR